MYTTPYIIEDEIVTFRHVGSRVFISQISFILSALQLPFEMWRRKFPIRLAFGMTVSRSQGQTLNVLGLYLATSIFLHRKILCWFISSQILWFYKDLFKVGDDGNMDICIKKIYRMSTKCTQWFFFYVKDWGMYPNFL